VGSYDTGMVPLERSRLPHAVLVLALVSCRSTSERAPEREPEVVDSRSISDASGVSEFSDFSERSEFSDMSSASLRGTVEADGAPLPDARVCAWKRSTTGRATREELLAPACVQTDASGGYSLSLAPGSWLVVASARDHVAAGQRVSPRASKPSAVSDFRLSKGGQLQSGQLIDLDGAPVVGAGVYFYSVIAGEEWVSASTTTDEHGRFELWVGDERGSIMTVAPGFAVWPITRDAGTYVALPESVISGRVVDEQGHGLAGRRVSFTNPLRLGHPGDAALSDTDGNFTLRGLPPGEYKLVVLGRHGAMLVDKSVYVGLAGVERDIVLALQRRHRWVRARVVERGGDPVAGCKVRITLGFNQFVTDEEGYFSAPVGVEQHRVHGVVCPGMVGTPPYPPLVEGRPITVEPGRVLRGRILDAAGEPVAGQRVRAAAVEREIDNFRDPMQFTVTDAEGRFELAGLAPGAYTLQVDDWIVFRRSGIGDAPRFVIGEGPSTEATFTMPPTGRVELRSSEARARQQLATEHCEHVDAPWQNWRKTGSTDERGVMVVERAPPGPHRAGFTTINPNCDEPSGVAIEVVAGRTTHLELPAVAPPPGFDVRVVRPDHTPVANAIVEFIDVCRTTPTRVDWLFWWLSILTVTDADGRASFEPRDCDEGCCVTAALPGEFGVTTVGPAGEIVVVLRPTEHLD
jgi:hypothetical protein